MSKCFIVCGSFRGGTTSIAQLLVRAGINMGDELDVDAGNYEDLDIQSLMKRGLTQDITPLEFNSEFKDLMLARDKGEDFGFKFPAAHFFMPQLFNFFPKEIEPHLILVFRDPIAIVDSEHRRAGADPKQILMRSYQDYGTMMNLIATMGESMPIHPISFEHVITRQEETVDDLLEFCDIQVANGVRKVMVESLKLQKDKESWGYCDSNN